MLTIPSNTPSGKPITDIGIWLSGGADSALLCYLLAKKIVDEKLAVKIHPLTIDYKRPHVAIAKEVVASISSLLFCTEVFADHVIYNPPADVTWTNAELNEQFHIRNKEHFTTGLIQILYSGITTNPPVEVQQTFNYGVLHDVELKRGAGVTKTDVVHKIGEEGEFYEIKPFFNVDKLAIAKLYTDNNLMDTLFPITRSCEDPSTVRGHCGECWWCQERKWGFGLL